ncbi:MAG: NAD-dependent epimerase/dehydratase family protein [Myxococcota bacterium]
MRVLVTGGLGFVGHAVVDRLVAAGHCPMALSSRSDALSGVEGVETVRSDIGDVRGLTEAVRRCEPDAVCHLAALTRVRDSFEKPVRYFDVNLGGMSALLRALDGFKIPVVYASTAAVYGPCEGRIDESQPTLPTNPYGASKLAAEQLLLYHARTAAVGAAVLRCFNITGAVGPVGDADPTRIIPKALMVAAGRCSHIDINGDGSVVREFTHVADVAAAVVSALECTRVGDTELYNVGSGVEVSMTGVVDVVEAVTRKKVERRHHPPKREPSILVADSTKLRAQLRWSPTYTELKPMIDDVWRMMNA